DLLQSDLAQLQQLVPRTNPVREEPDEAAKQDDREPNPETTAVASKPTGAGTLRYWTTLNDIIDQESANRGRPGRDFSEHSAADFLQRRVQAARTAAGSIRQLIRLEVDLQAVELSEDLAKWYDDCAAAAEAGSAVLGSDSKSRRGAPGQDWQRTERRLQGQVAQINRSASMVRKSLTLKYRLKFPALH
ncbi:MAG: hypothetical protein O3A00_26090, partial [Planctomycetota bacterium]|nr:hypothetical protein [Planctomycetota bacterium]